MSTKLTRELATFLDQVNKVDFGPLSYKLANPGDGSPAMAPEHAFDAIKKYKAFLFLCRANKGKTIVPSRYVDHAWHTHIMDTALYFVQTTMLFGHYLHHQPVFEMSNATESKKMEEAADFTIGQAHMYFDWDDDDWCGTKGGISHSGQNAPWLDPYANLYGGIKWRCHISCMPIDALSAALGGIITVSDSERLTSLCNALLDKRPAAIGYSAEAVALAA